MKIKLSKITIVLIILVLLGPVFDLLTGYTLRITGSANAQNIDAITPGVFYRGLFLIPVFIILAHLRRNSARLIIYFFGIIFFLGIIVRGITTGDLEFVRNTQRYLKLMLPIFGFVGMLVVSTYFGKYRSSRSYWQAAAIYGGLAAFGLLTTDAVGLALKVYRRTNVASAGLIDSQNAAGLVLIVSLPLALYFVFKFRNNGIFSVLLVEALWLAAAFRLNTRAVLVAVPAVLVFHHLFLILKGYYTRTVFRTLSWIVLSILTIIVGFIIIQNWLTRDVNYLVDRFEKLAAGEFRNRVPIGIATIEEFSVSEHLFGQGDRLFLTTENDFVDVYGKFGLTTLIPIFIFFGYFYFKLLVNIFRYRSDTTFYLLLSISLYMFHGVTAGHALLSSPVNNLFLLVYLMCYLDIKQYEEEKEPDLQTADNNSGSTTLPAPAGAALTRTQARGEPPLAYDN